MRAVIGCLNWLESKMQSLETRIKLYPRAMLVLFIGLILLLPIILTNKHFYLVDFSNTGEVGDTISGITNPIIGILSALLIYYALKEQIRANQILQDQLKSDREAKEIDNETQNLNQLYSYIKDSISNFRFKCLTYGYTPITQENEQGEQELMDGELLEQNLQETFGSKAFATFFNQINCNYHGEEEELLKDPCVSEVYSILVMIESLLSTLHKSQNPNKNILITLIQHQFFYRIIATIRDSPSEELKKEFCNNCKRHHGFPPNILDIIERIRTNYPLQS